MHREIPQKTVGFFRAYCFWMAMLRLTQDHRGSSKDVWPRAIHSSGCEDASPWVYNHLTTVLMVLSITWAVLSHQACSSSPKIGAFAHTFFSQMFNHRKAGWWFGCHLDYIFPLILGWNVSSSPLTKSYFSEGFFPNHQPVNHSGLVRWRRGPGCCPTF